jgi:recombination endonuclease VII
MATQRKPCADCGKPLSVQRINKRKRKCYACERAALRDRQDKAHDAYVVKTYGLQPGDYQRLYDAQGGRCYICQRATGRTRRLAVDHDHATGLVRGLLCKPCNRMLGHARDDYYFFARAQEYLTFSPAQEVGIVARYNGKAVDRESARALQR